MVSSIFPLVSFLGFFSAEMSCFGCFVSSKSEYFPFLMCFLCYRPSLCIAFNPIQFFGKSASVLSQASILLILVVKIEIAFLWYSRRCFNKMWEVRFKVVSHFLHSICSRHFTWGTKGIVGILRPFGTIFLKHDVMKDRWAVCFDL